MNDKTDFGWSPVGRLWCHTTNSLGDEISPEWEITVTWSSAQRKWSKQRGVYGKPPWAQNRSERAWKTKRCLSVCLSGVVWCVCLSGAKTFLIWTPGLVSPGGQWVSWQSGQNRETVQICPPNFWCFSFRNFYLVWQTHLSRCIVQEQAATERKMNLQTNPDIQLKRCEHWAAAGNRWWWWGGGWRIVVAAAAADAVVWSQVVTTIHPWLHCASGLVCSVQVD